MNRRLFMRLVKPQNLAFITLRKKEGTEQLRPVKNKLNTITPPMEIANLKAKTKA